MDNEEKSALELQNGPFFWWGLRKKHPLEAALWNNMVPWIQMVKLQQEKGIHLRKTLELGLMSWILPLVVLSLSDANIFKTYLSHLALWQ